jgi:ABC-type nitrate/sulfonate/bicarbonate transport system substrate-binding protein
MEYVAAGVMEYWSVGVMGIRIRFAIVVFSMVMPLLASSFGHAAEKLRVATGGFSPSVPPFISFAKPQLIRQDFELEDVLMSSGSLSAQALASGQVKIVLTTSAVVPQFNLSGGDMVIVAGTINKLPYQIVARGEIKTPALLKGKRVAISRFGSSSEWLVRLALAKMGLDPDKDVTII